MPFSGSEPSTHTHESGTSVQFVALVHVALASRAKGPHRRTASSAPPVPSWDATVSNSPAGSAHASLEVEYRFGHTHVAVSHWQFE